MHREYSVLKIYTKLNIYAGVIMGALEIYTRSTVGDEVKGLIVTLDRIELFMILVLQIATICLAYPFFIRTKDKDIIFRPGGKMKFRVDYDSCASIRRICSACLSSSSLRLETF